MRYLWCVLFIFMFYVGVGDLCARELAGSMDMGVLKFRVGDVMIFVEGDDEIGDVDEPLRNYFQVVLKGIEGVRVNRFELRGFKDGELEVLSEVHRVKNEGLRALNPWWLGGEVYSMEDGFLWLSEEVYRYLLQHGEYAWLIDTVEREDRYVLLKDGGEVMFDCKVYGENRMLRGRLVISNKGDRMIVLDSLENPLVLSISSSYFSWRLLGVQ